MAYNEKEALQNKNTLGHLFSKKHLGFQNAAIHQCWQAVRKYRENHADCIPAV